MEPDNSGSLASSLISQLLLKILLRNPQVKMRWEGNIKQIFLMWNKWYL